MEFTFSDDLCKREELQEVKNDDMVADIQLHNENEIIIKEENDYVPCEISEYEYSEVESKNCHVNNESETSWKILDIKNPYLEEEADISSDERTFSTEKDPLSNDKDPLSNENDPVYATEDELPTTPENVFIITKIECNGEDSAQNDTKLATENDFEFSAQKEVGNTLQAKTCESLNENSTSKHLFCAVCDKMFITSSKNFELHMLRHSKENPSVNNSLGMSRKHQKRTQFSAKSISSSTNKCRVSNKRDFPCPVCFTRFNRSWHLKVHMIRHSNEQTNGIAPAEIPKKPVERKHQCLFCHKSFGKNSRLKMHERTHTGEKPYRCRYCEKSFAQKQVLVKHERTHTGEKPYTCDICGKSFTQSGSLRAHSKIIHEQMYDCSTCGKEFVSRDLLKDHQKEHYNNQGKYHCSYCNKSFPHLRRLKIHELSHTGDKPFACNICGLRVGTKSSLNRHLLAKHNKKFNPPDEIDISSDTDARIEANKSVVKLTSENNAKIYITKNENKSLAKQKSTLAKQVSTAGKKAAITKKCEISNNKALSCPVCFTQFNRSWHLKVHMIRHSKERPNVNYSAAPPKKPVESKHQCPFCNKSFGKNCQLKMHERTHTGEKPYGCRYCEKSFSQKQVLVKHERTHTGEKPFSCDICGKSFTQRSSLRAHSGIIHKQMYDCSTCGKEFVSRDLLKDHQKEQHHYDNSQGKYHCSFCNKSFQFSGRLKIHEQSHAGERLFACNICGLRICTKSNLNRHLLTKHNKKVNPADEIPSDKEDTINDTEKPKKSQQTCSSGSKNVEGGNVSRHCSVSTRKSKSRKKNTSTVVIYRKKYNLWIENDVKQYQCISCKQEFQDVALLQEHDCGHSKKTFRCSFCSMSFAAECHLESHIRVHTGEKPFKCETCGKSYSERCTLLVHEKTSHVSSSCNICRKEFATKYLLKEHGRSEHRGNQFACKQCGKEFKTVYLLKRHEKRHTVVNPIDEIGKATSPGNETSPKPINKAR